MDDTESKVRENRLRRLAARQGLQLEKSRVRDPRAVTYGRWFVVQDNMLLTSEHGMTLDEVAVFLEPTSPAERSVRNYAEVRKLLENMAKQMKAARAAAERAHRKDDIALADQLNRMADDIEAAAAEFSRSLDEVQSTAVG
jgi:hypothetical protein